MATGEHGAPPTEEALERMLTAVGPLLRRRAAVGAPDPAFVTRLRARLVKTGTTPDPTFAPSPRGHPTRMARGRGAVRAWRWRRVVAGLALAVALLALLAVAAVALVWLDLVVAALVAVALIAVVAGRRRR